MSLYFPPAFFEASYRIVINNDKTADHRDAETQYVSE